MKERPILFSGQMVRAILDGRKTQTRRVIKKPEWYGCPTGDCPHGAQQQCDEAMNDPSVLSECPYGVPGDRMWVRETLYLDEDRGWQYADTSPLQCPHERLGEMEHWLNNRRAKQRACVSIHMPRWASRITLEVVSVRVERLQEISEADAKAEGVTVYDGGVCYRDGYAALWDQINGPGSWSANPWVWVVEFKRLEDANGKG